MKRYIALALAAVSLFAACDNGVDAPPDELVRVGIGLADTRSVLPNAPSLEDVEWFALYGTTSSKENWLADFVYKNGAFYDYNNQNVRAAAYIKPGNWSFTLYGYPPEGSGSAKLKGTATANITAGFTGTVNFTLSPYMGEGDGAVYLRINLPQGSDVASVETTIDGTALDPPLPVNAGAIEYASNETPAGQYLFSFALKDSAEKTVAVVSDVVVVAEGAESSKQYTLTDADLNGPPSAAPSNLAVASYNAESLTFHFTWVDNSVNETGFTLTDGTTIRTAPAASQSLDFPVTDPAAAVTYTIKAVNAFGESASTQITGPVKFTVTFDADDGSGMTESRQVNAGASFGANLLAPPMRTNYSFEGWYPNRNGAGEEFTAYSEVLSNITVYAKWAEGIRYELTQNPAFDNYIYNAGDILPSGFYVNAGDRIEVSFSIRTDTTITGLYVGIGDWNNSEYYNGIDEDGWIAPGWSDTKTVQADGQFHQYSWTLTALSDAPAGIEPLVFRFAIDSVSAQRVVVYVKDMLIEKKPGVPRNLSLIESLAWISNNAVEGGDYTITLNNNETIAPQTLSYNSKQIGIALNGGTTEQTISLSSNGSLFTISEGVTLTLGNNVTLQGRSANTASLAAVDSGGALVMESGSKISGNTAASGGGVYVSGTFTMNGGEISDNTASGGGVYVSDGTFTMSGGAVSGNTSASLSGGVYVFSNGTFEMSGGEISDNIAASGGGVYVSGGTFTMSGGTVSGNTATSSCGGVYVFSNGTFEMSGGEISGNTASYGGGVDVSDGTFTMSGGVVSGNTSSSGGGVYVSGGTFTMSSGAISGNTASSGGGVYVSGTLETSGGVYVGGTFEMSGGAISGNIASSSGGGVYVGGTFEMSGGAISGNIASSSGGGVYVSGPFEMSGVYMSGGTFTKQAGGVIYGSNAGDSLKNTTTRGDNYGHAVYAVYTASSLVKKRNTTAGVGVTLNSSSAGGWE